jgi:hypothetical protein
MSITNRVRSGVSVIGNVNERLDRELSEYGLILLFLVAGLYMFNGASEFSEAASQFPRLTSGVVIVGTALLLLKNVLPDPIRTFVEESDSVLGPGTEEELAEMTEKDLEKKEQEEAADEEPAEQSASADDEERVEQSAATTDEEPTATMDEDQVESTAEAENGLKALVAPDILILLTPLFMLGYIVLSLLIGMLWASPIFVVLYLLLTGQRWYTNVAMTALAFIIPYGFMVILNFDLHTGILIPEGLGILEALGLL